MFLTEEMREALRDAAHLLELESWHETAKVIREILAGGEKEQGDE